MHRIRLVFHEAQISFYTKSYPKQCIQLMPNCLDCNKTLNTNQKFVYIPKKKKKRKATDFFFLLPGVLPFPNRNPPKVALAVHNHPPPPEYRRSRKASQRSRHCQRKQEAVEK